MVEEKMVTEEEAKKKPTTQSLLELLIESLKEREQGSRTKLVEAMA